MTVAVKKQPDSYMYEATASVFIGLGTRTGDPGIRTWALDYAAEVDKQQGEGHDFGRRVLKQTFHRALGSYFVRGGGMSIPGEESVRQGRDADVIHSEGDLKVLHSVMGAYGLEEGKGILIRDAPPEESTAIAIASFDFSIPGVEYVRTATNVIAWDQKNTLFI